MLASRNPQLNANGELIHLLSIEGLPKAMGELLQVKVTVPPYAQYIGAVGAALLVSGLLEG